MRKIEKHRRNLRHSKKRVAGERRYGKPEARALKELKRAEKEKLRAHFEVRRVWVGKHLDDAREVR